MELKHAKNNFYKKNETLLIVPYGIETICQEVNEKNKIDF